MSAREAYLRACTYYRAALAFVRPGDRCFLDMWEDMRSCFRHGVGPLQPPIAHVEVPFGDKTLPGYFMRVGTTHIPRPTLIMIGGGETFAEELYFWAAAPGVTRGYNTLLRRASRTGQHPPQRPLLPPRR